MSGARGSTQNGSDVEISGSALQLGNDVNWTPTHVLLGQLEGYVAAALPGVNKGLLASVCKAAGSAGVPVSQNLPRLVKQICLLKEAGEREWKEKHNYEWRDRCFTECILSITSFF